MRRTGSAAPHNNWSPTVNAAKYSGPIANLRKRPTGTLNVPVTLAGVNSRNVVSLSFGITLTHSLCDAIICSISSNGKSFFSLMVNAWLWQRNAPIRTHKPSTGIGLSLKPKILLVSA